ncbi:iron-containing alcohol dehydrogenase [Photobacterium gaetbulicola]|uniref:iron-containing alcohol dehydrogenase n=1 Tax=Photobacterium gaetbulicola TaxID=1295392 RepID=UPI000AA462B9|nr:iron-containing alcohol dehydrogenase [Photobacterium gaetbulicola]
MLLYKTVVGINKQLNKLITIPFPQLEMGTDSVANAGALMAEKGAQKVLIVTDAMIHSLGLTTSLCDSLQAQRIEYVIYDEVKPNPTIANVAVGADLFREHSCNAIIAIGGGSPIDCAKAIGAKVVRNKPVRRLAGKLKIRKRLPPFMAIPTTAGTGSEATVAAVVSDPGAREKFTIVDPAILPDVALIDPKLMVGLPKPITAATGMDALTHAIEAFIGTYHNPLTDRYATEATEQIFIHLPVAFHDGTNLEAREQMAIASYKAGCAFTRAYVGYVHAFAHQLGGMYNIPHGLANAVLLPNVLTLLKPYCEHRLALLAEAVGLSTAQEFIDAISNLNAELGIPTSFPELKEEEIPLITKRALAEAHGTYPVPGYLTQQQGEALLKQFIEISA